MANFGIIGCGRMGKNHAKGISGGTDGKVVAVYDITPEAAAFMRETYGAEVMDSAEALAANPKVDCVIVTSPTYCHLEGVRAAVQARKHVFCEKPVDRTWEAALEIERLVQGYDKLFTIGFVRRYLPKTRRLKALLDEEFLGRIRFCNVDLPFGAFKRVYGDWFADFDKSGGVCLDMLAHPIDLCNWFFGTPARIYADGMLLDQTQEIPSDHVAAVVTYENGVTCNLMCNWQHFGRSGEMMEIYGEKGALAMDGSNDLTYYPLGGEKQVFTMETIRHSLGEQNVNVASGYQLEMQELNAALDGKTALPKPSIQDAMNSLKVGLKMIDSIRSKRVELW
jgi:predicted dehydrogenase